MIIEKRKLFSICISLFIIFVVAIVTFIKFSFKSNVLAANAEEDKEIVYEKANIEEFNIEEILKKNTKNKIREEIITEEIDLEYTTIYKNNNEIAKGKMQVLQEGRDGKQSVITKKTYNGDELVKEEQTGRVITTAAIDKIIEVGTGSSTSNHKIVKGDKLYVTSYTLNLMQEKDKNSNKITTLSKDDEVKVIEVSSDWYKVTYENYTGWVDCNCLAYREVEVQSTTQSNSTGTKTKAQLLSTLSENMKLNTPSGLTLEQFKKVLSKNENDTKKIFENNAEYFYYIEKQYKINGIFVAAVGIHESGWGTSKIAQNKKNLFGYGANDANPYENAYSFSNYSEGIDLIARVFVKYYLNPVGTKIYDKEVATGKYYSGPTIADVNKIYATDKNWHNGVYKWMSYLYNKL